MPLFPAEGRRETKHERAEGRLPARKRLFGPFFAYSEGERRERKVWRLGDLRRKEVINIRDGRRLGYIMDLEIDETQGRIEALVVPGPSRLFGLFGREEDYIIDWNEIETLGEDIVLVRVSVPDRRRTAGKEQWLRRGRHYSY